MRKVFSQWQYIALACSVSICTFVVVPLFQNSSLIEKITTSGGVSFSEKVQILSSIPFSGIFDFDAITLAFTFLLSLLGGINVTLLVFYVRYFRTSPSLPAVGSGVIGILSSVAGFGCVACGAVFFGALSGSISGVILASLPFEGKEFSFIALLLLSYSSFSLGRAIQKNPLCIIE